MTEEHDLTQSEIEYIVSMCMAAGVYRYGNKPWTPEEADRFFEQLSALFAQLTPHERLVYERGISDESQRRFNKYARSELRRILAQTSRPRKKRRRRASKHLCKWTDGGGARWHSKRNCTLRPSRLRLKMFA